MPGSEELERLLDPKMNHPPAPEVGDRDGSLNAGQWDHPERVEDRDVECRRPNQIFQANASGPELRRSLP